MEMIAAPSRQFRTWSMWLLIATGMFDLTVLFLKSLGDLHVMSAETLAIINAVLVFITGAVRFILQNIPATTEQKTDLVAMAAAQPMKSGEASVAVKIDDVTVPSNPKEKEA